MAEKWLSSPPVGRRVIAVAGKGGAGKTMLVALMVTVLSRRRSRRVLAIDADSAVSLPHALGFSVERTIADIRRELIEDSATKKKLDGVPVREVIAGSLAGGRGIKLLVMGCSDGPGCFCALNDLLRYGIETLSRDFDVTVIDCESGLEQVNRRVIRSVDTLIIVADTSVRSIRTAALIKKIADGPGAATPRVFGLVVNRVRPGQREAVVGALELTGLRLLGFIPEDENINWCDLVGRPLVKLPVDSPALAAVEAVLQELGF